MIWAPFPEPSICLKSPGKQAPSRFLNWGPLWRQLPISRTFFYILLEHLNKPSPNKKKFLSSLEDPRKGTFLHVPPKRSPYGKKCPFPEPSFTSISNTSINLHLIKRNFFPLSKTLGKERSSMFPQNGAPMERSVRF